MAISSHCGAPWAQTEIDPPHFAVALHIILVTSAALSPGHVTRAAAHASAPTAGGGRLKYPHSVGAINVNI